MDNEGYPTDEELKQIEEWDYNDPCGFWQFVKDRWAYADWGIRENYSRGRDKGSLIIHLSTAGWSGNEDIIRALEKNLMIGAAFQMMQWRRGGHYIFQIPKHFIYKKQTP